MNQKKNKRLLVRSVREYGPGGVMLEHGLSILEYGPEIAPGLYGDVTVRPFEREERDVEYLGHSAEVRRGAPGEGIVLKLYRPL